MEFLSPRKKKRTVEIVDDTFTTPKKLRRESLISSLLTAKTSKSPSKHTSGSNADQSTTPASTSTSTSTSTTLPPQFARLLSIQTSLQHALSVALATSAVSPSIDTGHVPNVLTHLSLTAAMGFKVTCDIDDIKRLCWLWEWDGVSVDSEKTGDTTQTRRPQVAEADEDEDNPFIDSGSSRPLKSNNGNADWIRGASGFIITPATHFVKGEGRRVPAYGIGIEVEINLAEGKGGGMASVARWTAEGDGRKKELEKKLKRWIEFQKRKNDANENVELEIPLTPLASLPTLASSPTKMSSLTALFKSKSTPLSTPSPQKSITSTPSSRRTVKEFAVPTVTARSSVPFPSTPRTPIESPNKPIDSLANTTPRYRPPSTSPTKSAGLSLLSRSITDQTVKNGSDLAVTFPKSTDRQNQIEDVFLSETENNSNINLLIRPVPFPPQTPSTHGRTGIQAETPRSSLVPTTPSSTHSNTAATPRRAALLERIRLKSFSEETPSKNGAKREGGNITREQLKSLGQEEMKRRVLLGRLDEVAATVWAAFSSPSQTSSTPLSVARKRRTMRLDEVIRAVVSSARVPISSADARESVTLLMDLCSFFLQPLIIEGEEWVEMPASNPANYATPPSPRRKEISEEEVKSRSPKSVRMEPKGGLRDVRERIRREMEECSI